MVLAKSILPLLLFLQPTTGTRRDEFFDIIVTKARTAGKMSAPSSIGRKHSLPARHGRAMLDSSVRSKIQRQLEALPATEFCSNLDAIELYMTEQFQSLAPDAPFLTEDEEFVCSCLVQGESLALFCGAYYTSDTISPYANIDYMTFQAGEDGTYTATSVGWCDYLDGSIDGVAYCEDFVLDSENPSKIASCSIADDTCALEDAPVCEVCEGGQSVTISSGENCYDFNIPCEEDYMGPFIYSYHVESPITALADEPVRCVGDAPTADEWCADLSEIEMTITEAFRDFQPELDIIPYVCECLGDAPELALTCESGYFDFTTNVTYRSTEVMTFSEQNGYMIPDQMQWCDFNPEDSSDFYCESFEFSFLQTELAYCEFGDCGAGFCELCSDGLSVGNSCFANNTCSESVPGAFLFAYKDTKLAAVDLCPPTDAPVNPPTPAPVRTPTPAPINDGSTPAPAGDTTTPAPVTTESKAFSIKGSFVSILLFLVVTTAAPVIS